MKLFIFVVLNVVLFSCQKKAKCSCTGDTSSETYTLPYNINEPPPIDQCQSIEDNSTDNYTCVFRS